jgi:hypothetical protein
MMACVPFRFITLFVFENEPPILCTPLPLEPFTRFDVIISDLKGQHCAVLRIEAVMLAKAVKKVSSMPLQLCNTGSILEGLHVLETFPYSALQISQTLLHVPEAVVAESSILSIIEMS